MNKLFIKNATGLMFLTIFFSACQNNSNSGDLFKICNKEYCEEGVLLDEKKEGVWKRYDKDGTLSRIEYYKGGVLDGGSTSFYKNGQIYIVGGYNDGQLHGNVSLFYENGNINFSDNYLYGLKDGYSYFFDKKGWLKSKWLYVSGKKDGNQYYFDSEKDTIRIEKFLDGQLIDSIVPAERNDKLVVKH